MKTNLSNFIQENEIQRFITITATFGIVVWGFFVYLNKSQIPSLGALRAIGPTITVLVVFWGFYFKWGWKIPVLKYFIYKKDLSGTWLGSYLSDKINEEGRMYMTKPGKMVLVVRQEDFLKLSVTAMTGTGFKSISYAQFLLFNRGMGQKLLAYIYSDISQNFGNNNIIKEMIFEITVISYSGS